MPTARSARTVTSEAFFDDDEALTRDVLVPVVEFEELLVWVLVVLESPDDPLPGWPVSAPAVELVVA